MSIPLDKRRNCMWKATIALLAGICCCAEIRSAKEPASRGDAAAAAIFQETCVFPTFPRNRPNYRIPAIILAPNGNLLVFAEKRNHGPGDVGDTDIVIKLSTDRGKTWGPEQVLYDEGYETHTDCTPVVDRETGKIWLFFLRDKKRFYAMSSADNGRTWCQPYSIHADVIKPEWDTLGDSVNRIDPHRQGASKVREWEKDWVQRYGIGPGAGAIQLVHGPKAGRILVPARHKEDIGAGRHRSFPHVFYSDDHGATWHLGGTVNKGGTATECQLVELADGEVMINMREGDSRRWHNDTRRLVAISADGGETWGEIRRDEALICPQCHASIIRYTTAAEQDRNRILFSNPASARRTPEPPYGRHHLTVRLSYDEGQTWPVSKTICAHPSGYSDLVVLDDMTIGIVYERGAPGSTQYWDEVHFTRFSLEWLTDGKDTLERARFKPEN